MQAQITIYILFCLLFICSLKAQCKEQQTQHSTEFYDLEISKKDSLQTAVMPAIIGLAKSDVYYDKMLIAFYDSDCNKCVNEMTRLMQLYQQLKENNIRVISISADIDKEHHKNKTSEFPWEDDLCDYEGVRGVNFVNYEVFGTPVFFLTDSENKLLEIYYNISDIQEYLSK